MLGEGGIDETLLVVSFILGGTLVVTGECLYLVTTHLVVLHRPVGGGIDPSGRCHGATQHILDAFIFIDRNAPLSRNRGGKLFQYLILL